MRIIAGSAGGRKFDLLKGNETRPTSEMVREALFGSIQFDIADSSVLDIFGGSGGLSLEAASRGAIRIVCNDSSPAAVAVIAKNVEALGFSDVIKIKNMDYIRLILGLKGGEKFDFIFADPPYNSKIIKDVLDTIVDADILSDSGKIIFEISDLDAVEKYALESSALENTKNKRYGKKYLSTFVKKGI